jgi:hypothetical protein
MHDAMFLAQQRTIEARRAADEDRLARSARRHQRSGGVIGRIRRHG